MNNNGRKAYGDYFTDEYGNVYSKDGRLISRAENSDSAGRNRNARRINTSPGSQGQNAGRPANTNTGNAYRQRNERYYPNNTDIYRQRDYSANSGNQRQYSNTYADPRAQRSAGAKRPRTADPYAQSRNQNGADYGTPYADPAYSQNQNRNTASRQRQPQRRRHPDFRTGFADRRGVRRRPGMKGYESTIEKDQSYKKLIITAVIIIVAAVVIALVIKAVSTEHIGTLPEIKSEAEPTDTLPVETEAPEEPPKASGYANRTENTVALGTTIDCKNAILIDLESNTVVAEKGGDEKIYPASMTKVMTALVAIEHCDNLDATFTVTNEIIAPLAAANASVAGFTPGEQVTVRDLLYGTILPSGADGTGALAVFVSGSEEEFAKLMNEKCEELGLTGTHFSDASGLHKDDHYSTCHDIALIMKAALENETLREILGTDEYTTSKTPEHPDGIPLQSTMYSRVDGKEEFDDKIEIIGGKTGYTEEAGNCLVSAARVAGEEKTWIFVCAGGESKWKPIYDTIHAYRTFLGIKYDGEYVPKYMR